MSKQLSDLSHKNDASLLMAILLTAFCSSLVSVCLTWLFIKKRYQMVDYVSKRLLSSSTVSSNRSSTASASSYNNYNAKGFVSSKIKCQNLYETPAKSQLASRSDLSLKVEGRATDSPTSTTTSAGSGYDANNLSPNATLPKFKQMSEILSSSDESFDPNDRSRYFQANKRSYILANSSRLNTDMLNITTNLLSSSNEPTSQDANIWFFFSA